MKITQSLEKWGNSQGIRLPKKVIKAARLKISQDLAISLRGRAIILTPVKDQVSLKRLLAGVTRDKVGGELDWSQDIGAERYE